MGLGRLAALGGWSPVLLVVVVCLPTCQLANFSTFQLFDLLESWRVGGVRQGAGRLGRARRGAPPLVGGGVCQLANFSTFRLSGFSTCWEVGKLETWRLGGVVRRGHGGGVVRRGHGGGVVRRGHGGGGGGGAGAGFWFTGGVRRRAQQEEAEGAVESFLLPRGKEKKGGGGFSRDMRVMGSPAAGCERADGESEYRVGGVQGLVLWFGGVRAHRRWGV